MKANDPGNSERNSLCYGDKVKIVNGKWLQCVNDDPTIWLLSKKP